MSKEEDKLHSWFKDKLPSITIERNIRPNCLKNNKSGSNLEVDIYLPVFGLDFEYQGGVHFKDIKKYKNNSDNSREHDCKKYDLVKEIDVFCIVEIFESDIRGKIEENIINRVCNTRNYYKSLNKRVAHINAFLTWLLIKDNPIRRFTFFNGWCVAYYIKTKKWKGSKSIPLCTNIETYDDFLQAKNIYNYTELENLTEEEIEAKTILQIDKNTNVIINKYDSFNDLPSIYNYNYILECCLRRNPYYKGFIWSFKDEFNKAAPIYSSFNNNRNDTKTINRIEAATKRKIQYGLSKY